MKLTNLLALFLCLSFITGCHNLAYDPSVGINESVVLEYTEYINQDGELDQAAIDSRFADIAEFQTAISMYEAKWHEDELAAAGLAFIQVHGELYLAYVNEDGTLDAIDIRVREINVEEYEKLCNVLLGNQTGENNE